MKKIIIDLAFPQTHQYYKRDFDFASGDINKCLVTDYSKNQNMIKKFLEASNIKYSLIAYDTIRISEQEFNYLLLAFPNMKYELRKSKILNPRQYIIYAL